MPASSPTNWCHCGVRRYEDPAPRGATGGRVDGYCRQVLRSFPMVSLASLSLMDTNQTMILTKVLPLFIYPLGAALVVGAIALVLSFTRWQRIGKALLGLALVGLWIAATPIFANWLTFRLESQFPPLIVEMLPQSDIVIV